jgi:predicted transcriptional regulator
MNNSGYRNPNGLYAQAVKRSKQAADALLLELVRNNPSLSYEAIAEMLGVSRWTVYTTAVRNGIRRTHGPKPAVK